MNMWLIQLFLFAFSDSASAGGRKTGGRKTGFMGKGKSHHRGGRPEESNTDHSTSNILNMDPDAPYRSSASLQS